MISKYISHVRSNSLPSKSSSSLNSSVVDILLHKFSTVEIEECSSSSSSSRSSICYKLCSVKSLYQGIENSIQLPSNQQALEQHRVIVGEVLEGSLILLDMCAFINDVLSLMKGSIFELESCIRRKNGCKKEDISAYMMSRKKIHKNINKYLTNLKPLKYEKSDTCLDVITMLKEAEKFGLITMKCVLGYLSRSKCKQSGWSLMTKLKNSKQDVDVNELEKIDQIIYVLESMKANLDVKIAQDLSKQLASQELAIFEFEECLEAISRCLLKTRVSLLNILSH